MQPTQTGLAGVRFDFNSGCRVELPPIGKNGERWRLRLSDLVTANIIFEVESDGGSYRSTKQYFIPFRIEVWRGGDKVFEHEYFAREKDVQVQIPVGTMGDAIAWFSYVDLFQRSHQCKLTCVISEVMMPLFEDEYPNIHFVTNKEAEKIQQKFYATYRLGLFFNDVDCVHQPVDFRYVGLNKTAAHILGVEAVELAPKISVSNKGRLIKEPYVCIAAQASTQCKYWNNPFGWLEIVSWLKQSGYRVICIDRDKVWGQGLSWNYIPHGAEDMTGALPLSERALILRDASFFVGLSSGLAWLAWAVGVPVVMISGFTHPNNEFHTPFRVFNTHACTGCWNDPAHSFDHFDFMWCPRHKNTERQFECTKLITVDHVKMVISSIPGFLGKAFNKKLPIKEVV
ncbi:autotransporter strand-loop-strand O-heptosyltransferase [Polynucleobacter sp. Ross1-W9]|nr:autotransporter strand-loop-strand O-heptosyltransferase [Polynucleobacter parvulilacunae]MBU3557446.1 autotransporter strand-loop-strand O-heptosyltransferase [Polynucleobacter parvulilacunae]